MFDDQPTLEGKTLRLSPLVADDREGLYAAAADPLIWAQHPARTRAERATFDPYFDFLLSAGGTLAVRSKATGQIIGCTRF